MFNLKANYFKPQHKKFCRKPIFVKIFKFFKYFDLKTFACEVNHHLQIGFAAAKLAPSPLKFFFRFLLRL